MPYRDELEAAEAKILALQREVDDRDAEIGALQRVVDRQALEHAESVHALERLPETATATALQKRAARAESLERSARLGLAGAGGTLALLAGYLISGHYVPVLLAAILNALVFTTLMIRHPSDKD